MILKKCYNFLLARSIVTELRQWDRSLILTLVIQNLKISMTSQLEDHMTLKNFLTPSEQGLRPFQTKDEDLKNT